MSFLQTLAEAFLGKPEDFKTLSSEFPDLETQLAKIRALRANRARVYRYAGVEEALGVPAIMSAVSLISNTVGSLSPEAWRDGALMTTDAPRLVIRPTPNRTPRWFYGTTAFYLASRGEFWWKAVHRDTDGNADALFPVPPWEVTVSQNDDDRMRPKIEWLGKQQNNNDWYQQMYLPDHSGLRGVGPLQLCGAAVSVAVEADAWAADFFSGSMPSLIGHTDQDADEIDLAALDAQWAEKPNNVPRWMTNGLELSEPPYNAQKAQLTESRSFQVGEVARMFDIPGPLLEYNAPGSSLTYQNQEGIWRDFENRCLNPHYLEPIQQQMSDLLPRTTAARFNTAQLLRADVKTRYEVYDLGIKSGVLDLEVAKRMEGLAPGNVDFASVPFSPPSAVTQIPMLSLSDTRCPKCRRMLGRFSGAYETKCPKCGTIAKQLTNVLR